MSRPQGWTRSPGTSFWQTLIDMSRDEGVTIFISTHFMNEAERCDRISLMHAGKVLAVGTPDELVKKRGKRVSGRHLHFLSGGSGRDQGHGEAAAAAPKSAMQSAPKPPHPRRFDFGRLWAYARRETMELLRDPIRMPSHC